MPATIVFRAKPEQVHNPDDSPAFRRVKIPQFTRSHCKMAEFRNHPKFGGFANSDLFPNVLARIRRDVFGNHTEYLRLDALPYGVTVDDSGFLTLVVIRIP